MYGGELVLGGGVELSSIALKGVMTLDYGPLEPALSVFHWSVGPSLEGRIGILRIGGGVGLGVVRVSSVTADSAALAMTLELGATTSLDIVTFSERESALYVGLKLVGAAILASDASPWLWGPSGVLGLRI
jgi:hypothetical protein